ncbi:50S ribosomal protein L10 [Striga asiatica]|uniref:50S ribosomal protein L10 n=1 Tax=Striga asiatica TaxID=4170 RepID=A0A5A7RDD0_STRAF|nr:50S ribosomal protein L10 [Striga asiatica]
MGRKRKIVAKSSAAAVEAKSSNLYRGISLSDEKLPSQTPVSERLDEDPSPDVRYKSLYFSSQKKVHERLDDGPSPDVHYKNLYFNSQKKLQELMEENYELVRKLEFAEGQVAAYQKMIGVMGPVKEVMFVSRFEKSIKDNVSLLPQAAQNCVPSTPAANANEEPKQKKRSYKKRKA